MSLKVDKNLEVLINRLSFELVNENILEETEINKLLGVLSNDGVYAMWVLCKSKGENEAQKLIDKIKPILNLINEETKDFEEYFQKISKDINNLLFLKDLLEKTLIYARYHAKAKGK